MSRKKSAKRLRMSETNKLRLQVVEEGEPVPIAAAHKKRPQGSAGVKRELESAVEHLQEDEAGDDARAAGPGMKTKRVRIKTCAKIASDESVENATEKVATLRTHGSHQYSVEVSCWAKFYSHI
jgi:hypothetical protein